MPRLKSDRRQPARPTKKKAAGLDTGGYFAPKELVLTNRIISRSLSVDNRSKYTRQQCRAGGRISGEVRRYRASHKHAEVRRLRTEGLSQRAIAALTGYSQGTVSRILKGVIRTCLTVGESLMNPWKPQPKSRAMREVNPPGDSFLSRARGRTARELKTPFRSRLKAAYRALNAERDPRKCRLCNDRGWKTQVCPMCGRADTRPFERLLISISREAEYRQGWPLPEWWNLTNHGGRT